MEIQATWCSDSSSSRAPFGSQSEFEATLVLAFSPRVQVCEVLNSGKTSGRREENIYADRQLCETFHSCSD
ncbi:Hypothetical protein NTJ_04008 [Nesidiocoris tenuis]|uniref:Uncharacterized protein n=1 Tax=Nesidiocoris tenuis TaxID=355587 RepID=A0ABN7AJZ5_9HEMI|nr:Hypothetical protein NTJ_04008 [Nesidiocoris tenuis]